MFITILYNKKHRGGVRQMKHKEARSKFHAMILYPDNDQHMSIMRYLNNVGHYKWIAMFHEGEIAIPEDELPVETTDVIGKEKDHYHVMIATNEPITNTSFLKMWGGVVTYTITVNSPSEYLLYMMHATYKASVVQQKRPYPMEDFKSNEYEYFLKRILDKTQILFNLEEIAIRCETMSLKELLHSLANEPNRQYRSSLFDTLTTYQHLIVAMNNQEMNERKHKDVYR